MKITHYLVIRPDQTVRVAKRPRLASDEVAIKVVLDYPPSWGKVIGEINVAVPDFAPDITTDGAVNGERE